MTTTDLLARLVGFPTVSADSNLPLIDWAEGYLADCGATTWRLPDSSGQKAGLFARIGPGDRRGVMLSAHSDVVPVDGQTWHGDPFRLTARDGRLYGRGATDMKGFLAAMLRVAAKAADRDLREPLLLSISYDEEVGCRGIADMIGTLETTVGRPRLCIVGEPTSMRIALGHKGKAAYRASCRGTAGHSARAPDFTNALHLGADFLGELRALQDHLTTSGARDEAYDIAFSTVHAGRMAGGTALNIVPDLCTLDYEIRHLPADDLLRLEDRLAQAARRIGGDRINIDKVNAYPGLDVAPSHPAVAELANLMDDPVTTKVGYGTEAGHFDAIGVPTLVCGPGDMAQGHIADEFIEESQLAACDRMLDRLLDSLTA
ncbi:acetylornithine deacetylase [Pelagovum pacificum]|uniref:Acetylornithine deacetylase n=1 Tax=Pelagovum pacificum TaxID=2588711 RepID=A0A5C5GAY9_9RHOB|nr:acetylornithine deacetylase [Pelagovum pacificum]QQA42045.1 acetylornithine deacetylase [Pelagovum pacificum]TNY31134.1 acetylornithine deacetylase [Pelagovum pacificum]